MINIQKFFKICPNCYWFDGKHCEIHHKPIIPSCIDYVNDTIHYKRVQRWLRFEPTTAIRNWNMLDEMDRRKFKEMYGEILQDKKVKMNGELGNEY